MMKLSGSKLCNGGLATALLLVGCSSQGTMPIARSGVSSSQGAAKSSGYLLYVAHAAKSHSKYISVVSVLTFPAGKPYARIELTGYSAGACSDTSGNVWVVEGENREYTALEFAHGGTKPIAQIEIGRAHGLGGNCAVDPTTGNLAISEGYCESTCQAYEAIWAGARRGKPHLFPVPFTPVSNAYDASGNLFVDGYIGSSLFFGLAELTNGSPAFARITLQKGREGYPGGIAWDGKYLDIVADGHGAMLYRVDVSNYEGRVVGSVPLQGLYYPTFFAIGENSIVASRATYGRFLSLWPYPAGGEPTKTLAHYPYAPRGLAISVKQMI